MMVDSLMISIVSTKNCSELELLQVIKIYKISSQTVVNSLAQRWILVN